MALLSKLAGNELVSELEIRAQHCRNMASECLDHEYCSVGHYSDYEYFEHKAKMYDNCARVLRIANRIPAQRSK